MSTHFEDIGYKFEGATELVELLNNNMEQAAYYDSADGQGECILLQPDKRTRFWYYKRKDEETLCGLDLHYQGDASFWVGNASWFVSDAEPKYKDEYGRLVPAKTESRCMIASGEGSGTTLCIDMVEAPLMGDPDPSCRLRLAVTAFAEEAAVDAEPAEETLLPIGMFAADGEMEPRVTMTGTVKSSTLQRNGLTGKFFYEVVMSCLGMEFTVVGNAAALKGIPKEGTTISGTFWLSATVKEVQYK